MKYIASCSFGKDSIATVILAKENNEPLDEIVYCEVMFDENTSAEMPEHRDFIYNIAIPKFEEWGYKVTVLRSKDNYVDLFHRIVKRSSVQSRNGKLRGFPMGRGCHMNSNAKVKPIRQYWKTQDKNTMQYIGIAIDEPLRLERVAQSTNQMSLLQKYNYTEDMAKQKCIEYGLLSPIYQITKRNGCWFCPNMRDSEIRHIRYNHNELWQRLIELSKKDLANPYFNCFEKITVGEIEEKFCLEDAQMTIFDFIS